MKKLDWKKILILIVAVVLVVGLIIFAVNKFGKDKITEEQFKTAEDISIKYITYMTLGYNNNYNGVDILFSKDKTTYEDLTTANILTTAIRYSIDKLNPSVDSIVVNQVAQEGYNTDDYTIYEGATIRQAIKEVFGVDFENQSSVNEVNFGYDYIYLSDYDVYLSRKSSYYYEPTEKLYVTYKKLDSKQVKNNIEIEIAVAYIFDMNGDNSKLVYTSDANGNEVVLETTGDANTTNYDIPEDSIDKFQKYTITLKKVNDKYVFDNIAKK